MSTEITEGIDPEFELARYLLAHHERLVTRSELRRGVARLDGGPGEACTQPLEAQVRGLAEKLKLDGRHGLRLTEVHRVGYRVESSVH